MASLNENAEAAKSDRDNESIVAESSSTAEDIKPAVGTNKKKLPELPPRKVKSEIKSAEIVADDSKAFPEKSNIDNKSNTNQNGDGIASEPKNKDNATTDGVSISNERRRSSVHNITPKVHEHQQQPARALKNDESDVTMTPNETKNGSLTSKEGGVVAGMQEYFVGLRSEGDDESSITLDKAKSAQELLSSKQQGSEIPPSTTTTTVDVDSTQQDESIANNGTKGNQRPNLRVETFQPEEKNGGDGGHGKSVLKITDETRLSQLGDSVPIETVAAQGGWTAKRVSITGQLFFERDADGTIQLDRPKETQQKIFEDDDEDSDIEQELVARKKSMEQFSSTRNQEEELVKSTSSTLHSPTSSTSSLPLANTQEKPVPLDEEMIQKIHSLEGNKRCVDCGASGQSGPTWASLSFGVLLCMSCSGTHRAFGSHISLVKSLTLDNWTSEQIAYLYPNGGNAKFKNTVKSDGKPSARYTTEEAALYRARLRALVKNEPLPDKVTQSVATQASISPPPSPQGSYRNLRMLQESKDATSCLICGRAFSVIVRKHFCRNCDRAVCARCAPAANTKPLPQLGLGMTPVRHCSRCYRSPFIDWNAMGLSSAEQAAEAEVRTEGSNGGHLSSRRKTIGEKKVVRRKTLGEALVGMMKRG